MSKTLTVSEKIRQFLQELHEGLDDYTTIDQKLDYLVEQGKLEKADAEYAKKHLFRRD